MITSATPEQWAKIDQIRQDCIDQQTEPISSEDCRKAVEDMWESLGKKKPQVVQVDGPYAMLSAFYALHLPKVDEHRGDIGKFQLDTGLDLNRQVGNSLASHIDSILHDKLYASLMQQLSTRLESVVSGELNKLFSGDILEVADKLNSVITYELWSKQRKTAQDQLNEPDYVKLGDKIPGDEQIRLNDAVKEQIAARLGEVTSSSSDQVVDQVGHRTVAELSSRFLAKLREIQGQLSQLVLAQVEKMSASASAIDDNDMDKLRHSLTSQIYSQTGGTIDTDSINKLFSPLVESLFGQLASQLQGALNLHNNPLVDEKGDDFTGQVYGQLSSEDADKLDQHSFESLDASINQQLDEHIGAALENSGQIYENKLSLELSSDALFQLKNSLIHSLEERFFSRLKNSLSTQLDVQIGDVRRQPAESSQSPKHLKEDLAAHPLRELKIKLDTDVHSSDIDINDIERAKEELRNPLFLQLISQFQERLAESLRRTTGELKAKLASRLTSALFFKLGWFREKLSPDALQMENDKDAEKLKDKVHHPLLDQLSAQLHEVFRGLKLPDGSELTEQLKNQLKKEATQHVNQALDDQLDEDLRKDLSDKVRELDDETEFKPLREKLHNPLRDQLLGQFYSQVSLSNISMGEEQLKQLKSQLTAAVEQQIRLVLSDKMRGVEEGQIKLSETISEQLDSDLSVPLHNQGFVPLNEQLNNQLDEHVRVQLDESMQSFRSTLSPQPSKQASQQVARQLREHTFNSLAGQLLDQLYPQLQKEVDSRLGENSDLAGASVAGLDNLTAIHKKLNQIDDTALEELPGQMDKPTHSKLNSFFDPLRGDTRLDDKPWQQAEDHLQEVLEAKPDLIRDAAAGVGNFKAVDSNLSQTNSKAFNAAGFQVDLHTRAKFDAAFDSSDLENQITNQLHYQVNDRIRELLESNSELVSDLIRKVIVGETNSREVHDQIDRTEEKLENQTMAQTSQEVRNKITDVLPSVQLSDQLERHVGDHIYQELSSALFTIEQELEERIFDQLSKVIAEEFAEKIDTITPLTIFSRQLTKQIEDSVNEINDKFRRALYSSVWWRAWSGWYDGAAVLGVQFNQANLDLFQRWCRFCPLVFPGESTVIVCRNPVAISWKDGLLHNDAGPSVEFADGFKVYTIEGIAVDEQIVMAPETQTIQQIEQDDNADRKAIRIARYGWPRYLKDIKAEKLDDRSNELEGTKEALFSLPDGETKLVVTCPTGRVFTMGVGDGPNQIKTCDEAQKWIHRGRTMLSRT